MLGREGKVLADLWVLFGALSSWCFCDCPMSQGKTSCFPCVFTPSKLVINHFLNKCLLNLFPKEHVFNFPSKGNKSMLIFLPYSFLTFFPLPHTQIQWDLIICYSYSSIKNVMIDFSLWVLFLSHSTCTCMVNPNRISWLLSSDCLSSSCCIHLGVNQQMEGFCTVSRSLCKSAYQ